MTVNFDSILQDARKLSDEDQSQLLQVMRDFLEQAAARARQEEALKDPDYRAYVERELALAEEDFAAGRVYSFDEICARIEARRLETK